MRNHVRFCAPLMSLLVTTLGCDQGGGSVRVETSDSAGVAIVTTHAADVPVRVSSTVARTVGDQGGDTEALYKVNSGNTAVDDRGNIYVLEWDAQRVHVFDSTGARVRTLGKRGGGPGELQFPLGLSVSGSGVVRVADVGKRKFVQWNSEGQLLEEIAFPQRFTGGSVGWTDSGMVIPVWAVDGQRVVLLDGAGAEKTLAAVSGQKGKELKLKSCGMGFTNMKPIFSPDLIWAAAGDRVVIARNPEYVIDEFVGGRLVRSIRRNVPPRAATAEAAKASLGDAMRVRTDGGVRVCDVAEVVEQQGFAPHLPTIGRMTIAPDGGLWVQRYTVDKKAAAIDLFDSDGRYTGTIDDGSIFPIAFLPDGRLLTTQTDELDVERLVIRTMKARGKRQ